MSVVCGIDPSLTSAGIAILRDGQPILIRHVGHHGRDGASYQNRSRRVRSQCQAVLAVLTTCQAATFPRLAPDGLYSDDQSGLAPRFDLAVIEGPSYGSQFGSEFDRAALWHGVYGALEAKGVPIAVIAPNSLKLWFTGNGGGTSEESKRRMMAAARSRFVEPISVSDEADAIAAATAGAYRLGDPVPWVPCERSRGALEKVEWPEGVRA